MLLKNMSDYFTKKELLLWIGSILTILISFILFKGDNTLSLIASLIGVTSLIFCAKGNPFGQFLIIILRRNDNLSWHDCTNSFVFNDHMA